MKSWWIGCSGFYYKHWKEKFYPAGLPQRKWFEYYCESFNTVELNVTFYRYPKPGALQGWYDRSPKDFRFAVKAPRLITHFRKFHNALRETRDFYLLAGKGLREKLGCVLFQLPPNLVYSASTLSNILATLDPAFSNVIEFRDESWWTPAVFDALREHKITFCGISYPGLPDEVVRSAPVSYYRFHGVPQLYASSYSTRKMLAVTDVLRKFRGVTDNYLYFNNDMNAAAVRNALALRQMVEA